MNANAFTYEAKLTTGKYHVHGRTVISPNGKMMTTIAKGTGYDGKALALKLVFDKQ